MTRYWSALAVKMNPYVPGEQPAEAGLVKLNTNENPYPPSSRVITALQGALTEGLQLYPDPDARKLRAAIADYHGLSVDQVFAGNGSDEVLAHAFCALLKHDKPVLFPDVTYGFYPVYCRLYGIKYRTVALTQDYKIRVEDYLQPNGGVIFPNPNAPTGCLLPLENIERLLLANTESVIVVDEAYIDFGGESACRLIERFPNLLVVKTFSKSRSLAGLRVGFALGNNHLIRALEQVKNSFNSYPLGQLALAGATAAMADRGYFERTRRAVMASREYLQHELARLGFIALPSAANFIFATHPQYEAKQLLATLREQRIIVRHFNHPRTRQFLRITVGTDEDCIRVINRLERIVGEADL